MGVVGRELDESTCILTFSVPRLKGLSTDFPIISSRQLAVNGVISLDDSMLQT